MKRPGSAGGPGARTTLPFLLAAIGFGALAFLTAADASLASLGVLPWFHGLSWLRVHFLAIGVVVQLGFGLLPALVASSAMPPPTRWDIWGLLNAGLLSLVFGLPRLHAPTIILGGVLVLSATALLLHQLLRLRPLRRSDLSTGRPFYLASLGYLLVGGLLGTGIWVGWSGPLSLPSPKETHVHANLWGFLALLFAGLLIDLYPGLARRPLARPHSVPVIFALMAGGAFGLVLGPWVQWHALTAVGLVVHAVGTLWLLGNALTPLRRDRAAWTTSMAQLFGSYLWFFVPVLAGPMVVLNAAGYLPGSRFASAELEGNGAPILIYGWALQFVLVVGPALYSRAFFPAQPLRVGGHAGSMLAAHVGVVCYAVGLFATSARPVLHGAAYLAWVFAALPSASLLVDITREGFASRGSHSGPG